MAYFDYSPVDVQPSGFSRIADALSSGVEGIRAKRRQQQQDELAKQKAERDDANQRAKQAYEEQLGRAAMASGQRASERDAITFQQQQADRTKATVQAIGRAQGSEGFGMARGLAAASQFVNPKTGRLEGVGYEPIPGAPDPGSAPTQGPEGPIPSPADRDAATAQDMPDASGKDMVAASDAAQAEDRKMQEERDSLPARQSAHQQATQAFQASQRDPKFNLTFPGGQSVEISGREQQLAAEADRKDKAQTLLRSMPPNTPPEVLRAVAIQAGLIGAGTSNADNAPITNASAAVQAQSGRMDLAGTNNAAKLELARTRAAKIGAGAGGKAFQTEERALAGELTKYETQHKLTGKDSIAEHQHDLGAAVQMAEAPNQNGVTQLKIMDKMIRAATGLGVRNQTLKTYQEHMGGLEAQGENKLEEWASGSAGKKAWANVVASVRGDLAEAQKRGGEENKAYWDMVGASPAMQRHPDLVQRRERGAFGGMAGYGAQHAATGAAQPAAAAHPVGETRKGPDGKMYRKVGPNNWQPI